MCVLEYRSILNSMKTEFVRIYSEEELHRKIRQASTRLKILKQKIADDPRFCDIEALIDMWVQYESTRFIVTESFLTEEEGYKYDPYSLYVEREVEDDYSVELEDPDSLHNGLVSLQFMFDYIQTLLSEHRNIDCSQYMNMHALVLDLTTDIYFHLNCSNVSENDKFLYLLDDLNYRYIYNTKWEIVPKELVVLNIIAKRCETETNLEKLITTLNLQLE